MIPTFLLFSIFPMKKMCLLILGLLEMQMCFGNKNDVEILMRNYNGEELSSIKIEASEANVKILKPFLFSCTVYEKARLLYSYFLLKTEPNRSLLDKFYSIIALRKDCSKYSKQWDVINDMIWEKLKEHYNLSDDKLHKILDPDLNDIKLYDSFSWDNPDSDDFETSEEHVSKIDKALRELNTRK